MCKVTQFHVNHFNLVLRVSWDQNAPMGNFEIGQNVMSHDKNEKLLRLSFLNWGI